MAMNFSKPDIPEGWHLLEPDKVIKVGDRIWLPGKQEFRDAETGDYGVVVLNYYYVIRSVIRTTK